MAGAAILMGGHGRRFDTTPFLGLGVVEKDEIERFGNAERLLANGNTPDELRDLEALLGHEL